MPPGVHRVERGETVPRSVVVKVEVAAGESRSSNATSEGELTRVGTCDVENVGGPLVRPMSEFVGKHAVDLDATSPIRLTVAPVNEAGESRAGD